MNFISRSPTLTNCLLGDIFTDARSGFASGETSPDGIVQVRMNNITQHGDMNWSKLRRVPRPPKFSEALIIQQGDILFNATNSPELVGKSALFDGFQEPVTFSNHFLRMQTNANRVDSCFLSRWLQLRWQAGTFFSMCKQWVNQASVSRDQLLALEVPLPPLDEQRRLAAILDQADNLRRKRRAALERMDQLTRADFNATFVLAEGVSWDQIPIGDMAVSIRTGPFGSQLLHSEFIDDGVAVFGIDNAVSNAFSWDQRRFISYEKYQTLKRYRVFPRDVLVTIMGTCGRVAIVPDNIPLAINTKHLCCLTLDQDRCLPEFLHAALLLHPSILHQLGGIQRGAVMPDLNMRLIKETCVRLPPIDLQRAFANRVAEIDALKAAHRAHLAKLDALFASLQYRAFQGEL